MWEPICAGLIHYLLTQWWQHLTSIWLCGLTGAHYPKNNKDSDQETYSLSYYLNNGVMIDTLLDYPCVTEQPRAS